MSELKIVTTTKGQWPPAALDEHPGSWVEITEEHYWYFLEVLPPIYFIGGFACSEPYSHDPVTDEPTYLCATAVPELERFFAARTTVRRARFESREVRTATLNGKLELDGSQLAG